MSIQKNVAAYAEAANGYAEYSEEHDEEYLADDPQEDKSLLEKRVADYIRVLRPRILVSAKDEVFQHELLAGLQDKFYRATSKPTIESLIDNVLLTRASTILLVDPPASLDVEAVSRRTCCYVLTLHSDGGAA